MHKNLENFPLIARNSESLYFRAVCYSRTNLSKLHMHGMEMCSSDNRPSDFFVSNLITSRHQRSSSLSKNKPLKEIIQRWT